jgi:hypothetical protein
MTPALDSIADAEFEEAGSTGYWLGRNQYNNGRES